MCLSQWQAQNALATLREILAEIGLEPKDAKTQVVHLRAGGGSFDFLGFEASWVGWRRNFRSLVVVAGPASAPNQSWRDGPARPEGPPRASLTRLPAGR